MFRMILVVLVALITFSSVSHAGVWVEQQTVVRSGAFLPQWDGGFSLSGSNGLGISGFALVKNGWSQFHVGPTWSPSTHCQLGIHAGVEQTPGMWRTAGTLWIGDNTASSFSVFEKGASGTWYKSVTTVPVSKNIRCGLFGQKYTGWGPTAELSFRSGTIWVAELLRSSSAPSMVVGIKLRP